MDVPLFVSGRMCGLSRSHSGRHYLPCHTRGAVGLVSSVIAMLIAVVVYASAGGIATRRRPRNRGRGWLFNPIEGRHRMQDQMRHRNEHIRRYWLTLPCALQVSLAIAKPNLT